MLRIWLAVFSIAAGLQLLLWPEEQTIICTLLDWCSCVATGLAILRHQITFRFPWSSLMILMFCLQTCGLPLCLLLIQGNPLDQHLRVPVATFAHLLLCQLVLIVTHVAYRRLPRLQNPGSGLRRHFLVPLGYFNKLSVWQIMSLGLAGLMSTFYLVSVTRLDQGGRLAVTGAVWERLINGFSPFSFAPFLLFFPNQIIAGRARRWLKIILLGYFFILFCVAAATNSRGFLFQGFAMVLVFAILSVFTGLIRLKVSSLIVLGALGLILLTFASDLTLTLRLARDNRESKTSQELIQDTVSLLTVDRESLAKAKAETKSGADEVECWYVFNPTLSRLVNTHFEDRTLAMGLNFDDQTRSRVRTAEFEKFLGVLPDPLLKFFRINIDKELAMGSSMGDEMELWAGESGLIGGFSAGGFIGDGYAAFGWWYLAIYGFAALILFIVADSLYQWRVPRKTTDSETNSMFPTVGFMYGYTIVTLLTGESVGALFGFSLRQPLQWLFLFGLFLIGFKAVSLISSPRTTLQPRPI